STGYSQTTTLTQNNNIPVTAIDNPFPGGLLQPTGNSLGLASGASSAISFFDPEATAPRIQQYSIDYQRELPGNISAGVGYVGSRNYLAFAAAPGILDNYNYIPGSPNYNPDVDYGVSLNDMAHKLVIAPIVQLPFGSGALAQRTLRGYLIGGWTIAAVAMVQSGFPIPITQAPNTTNLNGSGQRPNVVADASV